MSWWSRLGFCVLVFHSPDGAELLVRSDAIVAIRPIDAQHKDHLPPTTGSVLYFGVRIAGFGVRETAAEANRMIAGCR